MSWLLLPPRIHFSKIPPKFDLIMLLSKNLAAVVSADRCIFFKSETAAVSMESDLDIAELVEETIWNTFAGQVLRIQSLTCRSF